MDNRAHGRLWRMNDDGRARREPQHARRSTVREVWRDFAEICPAAALGMLGAALVAFGAGTTVLLVAAPSEFYAGLALLGGAGFLVMSALGVVAARDRKAPVPARRVASRRRMPPSANLSDLPTMPVNPPLNGGMLDVRTYYRTGRLEITAGPGQDRGARD